MKKDLTCPSCLEGKLKWKRKTTNIYGFPLRIYECQNCGLENRKEEIPGEDQKVDILTLRELVNQ